MNFFRLYSPQLSDIRFHESTWELHENTADSQTWYTHTDIAARILLSQESPPWPFDLRDINAARTFFDQQANGFGGVMLELDVKPIQGIESLIGIFKYRSPQPPTLGMHYVGIIWLPFQDFIFQINFESRERGTTGLREAIVTAMAEPQPVITSEPETVTSIDALFDKLREGTIRRLPSDDSQFDEMFPDHPLTKVRNMEQHFIDHAIFHRRLSHQKPYRVKSK